VTDRRLTLRQAAAVLGVSESAIRKRVERGTLRSDKGSNGRRYVYLDTGADNVADTGEDTSTTHERGALISELRAHNDTLREQLDAERQAHAEARRIIAGLVERIPALEAPPSGPGSPEQGEGDRGTVPAESQHVDEATKTEREGASDRTFWIVGWLFITFLSFVGTVISGTGESLVSTVSSVASAFSTAASSGLSALTGDQVVQIVGSIITVVGTIAATYLGIRWSRRGRRG
jgi:hypothetical protein